MWFTVCIEQNMSRIDVSMQNAVFMRVVHGARDLRDELHCASNWHRLPFDNFIKLAAFNELHAEVTATFSLADVMNGNNPWMFQTGGSFRLSAKSLHVRFGRPSS